MNQGGGFPAGGAGGVNPASTLEVLMDIHRPGMEANLTYGVGGSSVGSPPTDEPLPGGRPWFELVPVGCVLALLDLTTVLGNLLVCVTICIQRRLRNTTNYLIFSLALSDLLLGLLVLPFSTINTLLPAWPLGPAFCNVYISTDVMLCTVSILNLFAISLERYFAVSAPLRYGRLLTFRLVMTVIAAIWLFSLVMAFVPIHLGWNTPDGRVQNWQRPDTCLFEGNMAYVLLVAVGTYFVPLIIMCVVYVKVFIIARDQVQRINQLVKQTIRVFQPPGPPGQGSAAGSSNSNSAGGGGCGAGSGSGAGGRSGGNANDPRLASDSKATVTLASVVAAFALCWIPYFVIFTSKPFLSGPVDPNLDLVALWLGYTNSMLNPFLYAFHSTQFRRGFVSVLTRRPMRGLHEEVYGPGHYV